jgi:fructose-1,6-bisphosphatase/inositol monophosphatase family enzyme
MSYMRELDAAVEIARKAGETAMHYFARETATWEKPDLSPVTAADRECEALISESLGRLFPEDGIVGEEGAYRPSLSGRRWLIDPIDGTRDFVRRNQFWSIQISLQEAGEVVLGIIYLPALDELFRATLGEGCFWNHRRCTVSQITDLGRAILMVSGFKGAWESWPPKAIRHLTETCWTVRAYGGCYDVTMIARGQADIWLSGSGMEFDYAPVIMLVLDFWYVL